MSEQANTTNLNAHTKRAHVWSSYLEDISQVLSKEARRQPLLDLVVVLYPGAEVGYLETVHDGREALARDERRVVRQAGDDGRLHEVAFPFDHLRKQQIKYRLVYTDSEFETKQL